jgi:hypothetical protein
MPRIMEQFDHIANQDEHITNQEKHISKLREKVAVMTISNATKHVFQLYKHQSTNKYIFIRAMSIRLPRALRVVDLREYELLLNEINVPNAMNILNKLKEKLREREIYYVSSNNKITTDAEVLEMVRVLIEESRK